MNSKQTNNLFISTSVSGDFTALELVPGLRGYSRLLIQAISNSHIKGIENIEYTGRLLAAVARKAHLARRMDVVEQAYQLMLALPLSEKSKNIALFHKALCIKWQGDFDEARRALEKAAEEATPQYRARSLQSIGATYYELGEADAALPFYIAAGKASAKCDPLTLAESQRMIAVVRSIHGDHKRAIDDLESLFPLVRAVSKHYPALYYDYLNSLAVEFGETGRIAEAQSAISIALSSPFAEAYPEWSETREEIEQKRNYPDSSRCFIERSFTDSEAIPETDSSTLAETERQTESAISSQPQSRVEAKPFQAIAFHCLDFQITCQRTSTLPNALRAIIPGGSAQSFLQRLGKSVQSRAPPISSYRF